MAARCLSQIITLDNLKKGFVKIPKKCHNLYVMFNKLFGPKISVGGETLLSGKEAERVLIDSARSEVRDTGPESYKKAVELLGSTKLADRLMELMIREFTGALRDEMSEKEIFDEVDRIRKSAGFK